MLTAKKFGLTATAFLALAGAFLLTTAAVRSRTVERTDFGVTRTATTPAWDARVAAAS